MIDFEKADSEQEKTELVFERVNITNCLNMLVTADFLKLENAYNMIWNFRFKQTFLEVINNCTLNLSGVCQRLVTDISKRMPLEDLLEIKERGDKFLSNIFKAKVESIL